MNYIKGLCYDARILCIVKAVCIVNVHVVQSTLNVTYLLLLLGHLFHTTEIR